MILHLIADLDIKENLLLYHSAEFAKPLEYGSTSVKTWVELNLYVFFNVAGVVNMVGAVWHAVAVWVYAVVVAPAIYHISLTYKGV